MTKKEIARSRRKELDDAVASGIKDQKYAKQIIEETMDNGKATIHVNINDLYNPLSIGNVRQMSNDIFEYVENSANLLPSVVPLHVIMHGVKEEDRQTVSELFKLHYRLEIQDILWDKNLSTER